ncbi:MAG: protein arginine kinase [Ruminococcaceae bacterium]|nr:protein arginine kinase [Oscillospiraceae bacterium]
MTEKWYRQCGEQSEMVISTRIRLARNVMGYPFPNRMTDEQREELKRAVREAVEQIGGLVLEYIELRDCEQRDILAMVERHLISYDFAKQQTGALLLSPDERISIMICEEDHLRIQVLGAGLDLEAAYKMADLVETALDERLHFAFDERLGYLTQCPTNLGTGMRASLMLHLPALQERGAIRQLSGNVSKLGLTIRGAYGEGTQAQGAFYQMSNQVTLGISETAAIENLNGIAQQIIKQEQAAREAMLSMPQFEDRVWRSYGLLKYARSLSNEEALKLLSNLRIGIVSGLITDVSLEVVSALLGDIHPGCLMAQAGEDLTPESRDKRRADLVRAAMM